MNKRTRQAKRTDTHKITEKFDDKTQATKEKTTTVTSTVTLTETTTFDTKKPLFHRFTQRLHNNRLTQPKPPHRPIGAGVVLFSTSRSQRPSAIIA